MLQTKDITYFYVVLGLWANVEIALGIICGCLPIFPRFFQVFGPKVSYIFGACFSMQARPRGIGSSGPSEKSREVDRCASAARGPHELQDEYHVDDISYESNQTETNISITSGEDRPRGSISESSKTDVEDAGSGRKKNRILKTVVIETRRERRRSSDGDVEIQLSNLGW